MSLIAMCCYDTAENKRTNYTFKTLHSLFKSVDFKKHRLIVIDNNSCEETKKMLKSFCYFDTPSPTIITSETNLGTAEAINLAWRERKPGEHCIKMDNDVTTEYKGWVDEMEEAIRRDPLIGQVGLKRKDCWESPSNPSEFYKSELIMLPQTAGERWIIVEKCNHIMGTCVMHSSALLDKVGYLKQPSLYGFDDSFMSLRSSLNGFKNVFLPHIEIEHIDTGDTSYQKWKEEHAGQQWGEYNKFVKGYKDGTISTYYNPYE